MDTTETPVPAETPPPPPPPLPPPQPPPEEENEEQPKTQFPNATSNLDTCDNKHACPMDAQKPRTSCAFDNFKNLVKNVAFASAKTNSFTSIQTSLLENHLDHLSPFLRTPDHPPYAAMIQEAIQHLNEEEGSGKESISTFIKENHNDLPLAHVGMLEHHLYILCKDKDLVQTEDGRYLLSNGAIERSDTSTALTSPSVGTSYNSFSSSSSSSGSESEYESQVLGKRKLLPKKQTEARRRKRIKKSGKSVFAGRTKSSITRLYKLTEEDALLNSSEEEESDEVESEAYRSTKQPWGGTTDSDSEFHEQENQNKKQKRKSRGKRKLNGKTKKTVKMQTRVAGRGRGRPPKKVVHEVSDDENCLIIEYKQETTSLDKQNMDSEQFSSPDEVSEKQNRHVDYGNEVIGEKTKLLQLIQESASGEDLPVQEDEEEEAYKQIEILVGHTEAATKKQGERDIRNCEQGVNSKEVTPVQSPIAGKGSGKKRGRPRKQLVFEKTNTIPEDMVANNETTGKASQGQSLQDEVPKKRRGRPRKLQDPNEEGKELKKKSVPGRKPGRPPKNDLSRQLQMVEEQFQTIKLQEMSEKTIKEDDEWEKKAGDVS